MDLLNGFKLLSLVNLMLICCCCCGLGTARTHKTGARKNLTCYFCHTLTDGDICQQHNYNVQTTDLPFRHCSRDDTYCVVRRHSYALNNSDVKVWMMERGANCSTSCINECVISLMTGEKMRLHLCTSCCQSSFCNLGNIGASANVFVKGFLMVVASVIVTVLLSVSSSR